MTGPPPARPSYLGTGTDDAFLLLNEPSGQVAATAVLICPPFGWEAQCSYRPRRAWAEALAAAGHPVARMDLPGTGDSGGGPRDPDRLAAWITAVDAAARWLPTATGCRRVAAIGIGLGGLVAALAAGGGAPIDDLVLWGAPARGRALVRELRAFARMQSWTAPPDPDPGEDETDGLCVSGFLISAATLAAIAAVELDAAPGAAPGGSRALLLERDGIEGDPRLATVLARSGRSVTAAPGPGYAAMVAEPVDARAPDEVIGRTADWLSTAARTADAPRASVPPAHASSSLTTTAGGMPIRERALEPGVLPGGAFGILAEPVDAEAAITAVFFNAGAVDRTGPGRTWVETSRRWAGRGVAAVRVDLPGIGEAAGHPPCDVPDFYTTSMVEAAGNVLAGLHDHGLPRRTILVGLCSGAYCSLHLAATTPRIAAVACINSQVLVWDSDLPARRDSARLRKLREPRVWRRILGRGQALPDARVILQAAGRRTIGAPARLIASRQRRSGSTEDPLRQLFATIEANGTNVLLAFSGEEPLLDELRRRHRLDDVTRWTNVQLVEFPQFARTHLLQPLALQRAVHATLDGLLDDVVAASPDSSADAGRPAPERNAAG